MKKYLFFGFVMIAAISTNVFASTFSDVSQEHWAYDSIEKMAKLGVVNRL